MNLQKLSKRLSREAKANPGRAGILALLLLVAVYYWAPLASGFLRGKSASPSLPAAPSAPTASAAEPSMPAQPAVERMSWKELTQAIESDPRMQPVVDVSELRNPFVLPLMVDEVEAEPEEQLVDIEITPEDAGLVLSSTIVGPKWRAALINGEIYEEGKAVPSEDGMPFILTQVGPQRVTLVRGGKVFELTMPRTRLATAADGASRAKKDSLSEDEG